MNSMPHSEEYAPDGSEEEMNVQNTGGGKHEITASGPVGKRPKATFPKTPTKKHVSHSMFATPISRRLQPQSISSARLSKRASETEDTIFVEGRGQIRTYVACSQFQESFLSRLREDGEATDSHIDLFHIKDSQAWNEGSFDEGFLKPAMEAMCADLNPDFRYFYHAKTYLIGSQMGKPDFVIAKASEARITSRSHWKDVELVMGHSSSDSRKVLEEKFSQWLRDAWTVFNQQPHRRCCYGVLFLRPHAFLCYADHGCAAVSEPLLLAERQGPHLEFLVKFLTSFMKSKDHERGRDPELIEVNDTTTLTQGGHIWTVGSHLFRTTNLIGRNIQVFNIIEQGGEERVGVCKPVWEEIAENTPQSAEASHRSECIVIQLLDEAGVRGLPKVWGVQHAQVKDPYAKTAPVPLSGNVFKQGISPLTLEKKMSRNASSSQESAHLLAKQSSEEQSSRDEFSKEPSHFFSPTNRQRQLYRILMSKCQPLETTVNNEGFGALMPIIRDAMICYYECYRIPDPGWLQADISNMNIMATLPETVLTGPPSEKPRPRGTIIDWNYSYPALGLATSRHVRSGTPSFMALELLNPKNQIRRRTLRHDLESFFAVVLYMATRYKNPDWKFSALAAATAPSQTLEFVYRYKLSMFTTAAQFQLDILDQLSPEVAENSDFKQLLENMRFTLYSPGWNIQTTNDEEETRLCEELFKKIMGYIDEFLQDRHGTTSLEEIDARKALSMAGKLEAGREMA